MSESAWSKELPKEAGWYWLRDSTGCAEIHRVYWKTTSDHWGEAPVLAVPDGYGGWDPALDLRGEWQRVAEPKP